MGDGVVPMAAELRLRYPGSVLRKNFDDSVAIMAASD
jgi:hypothetical protein